MTTDNTLKHRYVILLFFAFAIFIAGIQPTPVFSKDFIEGFARANEYYRNTNYSQAIKEYEKVLSSGYESPELYFNLGNAYYKSGQIAPAILQYERALRLAPFDEDIEFNLAVAQTKIIDKIEPAPRLFIVQWWKSFANLASSEMWGMLTIVLLWVFIAIIISFVLVYRSGIKKTLFISGIIVVACFILTATLTIRQFRLETGANGAIVFAATVTVKSAPQDNSNDLFVLHEGTKVEVTETFGEWKKIRIADGNVGWLRTNTIHNI